MAPSRNPTKVASTANPIPYSRDARPTRSRRSNVTAREYSSNAYDDTADYKDKLPGDNSERAAGAREIVTPEQFEALENMFWETWGYPSLEQKEEIAARLGK